MEHNETESMIHYKILESRMENVETRMDKYEEDRKVLYEMNTNIKLIAQGSVYQNEKIDSIATVQQEQGKEIKEIKESPMKNWNKVKWTIVTAIATSAVIFILSNLPEFISNL